MVEQQQRVSPMKVAAPAHAAAPSKRRRGAGRQMEIAVLGGGVIRADCSIGTGGGKAEAAQAQAVLR